MQLNPEEETQKDQAFIVSHQLVNAKTSKVVNEKDISWDDKRTLHVGVCDNHFVPLLNKSFLQPVPEKAQDSSTTVSKQCHTPDGFLLAVFNGQDKLPYSDKAYSATYFLKLANDGRVLESVEILTDQPLNISEAKSADDDPATILHHFFFYGAKGEYLSSYTENMSQQGAGLQTPLINSRYGLNAKGGCALGFNTDQAGWAFQNGTSTFYLADYSAPLGAHWTMLQNTPAGNHSSLDGLLLSQLPNWEKQGSMETSYPPMTSERYIVQEGDTFESISQQFYSNKNYSTDVAMNNGFMSNQTQGQLIAGQVIRLPQYTPLSNNVKNSLPYQKFMAIMEGNLSPYMVIQQEQSFLAVILEIVAVVVAIAAAPHLAPEIFATVTALTLSVVAAGVAALTEFFGQEFLVQLGVEKNISWGDIESAALSAAAGVKGGLMSGVNIGSNVVIQAAMRAGIVNVVSQFAEFAAGDIKALDLKQILASMVGAGLGQKVLPQLDNEFQWGQTGDDAASAVMDGFIDSAIEQRGLNVENMAMQFAQSASEDWLSTGRGAISQAAARDSETKPATGKIPAPADTGNAWKTSGREAEKQAAANDDRWKKVGAASTHQSTAAQNHMLNQMQQAIAKSTDISLSADKMFNMFSAQVGAYDNLNAANGSTSGNSNNSSWQNAARASASVNATPGFWNRAYNDVKKIFQDYGQIEVARSYARVEAITGHRLLDPNTLTPQERSQYYFQVGDTEAYSSSMEATGIAVGSMFLGPEVIAATVPELLPAASSMGYYLSSDGLAAMAAPAGASLFAMRAGLNGATDIDRSAGFFGEESTVINASSPSEIAWGYGELSTRQAGILGQLPNQRAVIQLYKSDINVTDLSALTAKTGDEFAMFTLGSRRLILRGGPTGIRLDENLLSKLKTEGWTWSAHVHPGVQDIVLNASGFPGDRQVLNELGQSRSLILNSAGRRNIFDLKEDIRITTKSDYQYVNKQNTLGW